VWEEPNCIACARPNVEDFTAALGGDAAYGGIVGKEPGARIVPEEGEPDIAEGGGGGGEAEVKEEGFDAEEGGEEDEVGWCEIVYCSGEHGCYWTGSW